jgi:hypothetical protein
MNNYLKNLIFKIKLLLPFSSLGGQLKLIHITEKFDVVERVPVYARIKF